MTRTARVLAACLLGVILGVAPLQAVGTAVVTVADIGGGLTKITVAWTSTAGGAVSANAFAVPRGELLQVTFIPGTGGTVPTDLYDVTVVDLNAIDVATGNGTDCSATLARVRVPLTGNAAALTHRIFLDGSSTLDVVVAAAGNAKTGSVILLIGR